MQHDDYHTDVEAFSISFTGPWMEPTEDAATWIRNTLTQFYVPGRQFHHGDCVGHQEYAFTIARDLGYRTVAHPPTDETRRAYTLSDVIHDPREYVERNRDMVDTCFVLIACPADAEDPRSGTWQTVRYARSVGCFTRNWWYERKV